MRISGATVLAAPALRFSPNVRPLTLYVGTYTRGESKGIYRCSMDPTTGALAIEATTGGVENPSFLAIGKGRLYSVGETGEFQGQKGGAVHAFAIDRRTGNLEHINSCSSHGGAPCYVSVTPNIRHVLVANYGGGNVAILPIGQDGALDEASDVDQHEGSSVNPDRQKGPHAHCIVPDATGRFAFSADLGLDRIMAYRVDASKGTLSPAAQPFASVKPGAGPRHFTFHPNGKRAYVINELDSTIVAFDYDSATGSLTETQTVSTLPEDFSGDNFPADIHVDSAGRFVYGSNRGHNSIVVFAVDPYSGALSYVQHQATGGDWPRNFGLDPSGRFLLAANQNSDNVVVFAVDARSGMLEPTHQSLDLPAPVCIRFL